MAWLASALWTLYVLLPAKGWGLLPGIPLGPLSAAAVCAIWLAWSVRRQGASSRLALALIALKLVGGLALLDRGLVAEYFTNDAFTPPAERSVEYPFAPFTRVDRALDFGAGAAADLPLFFLNDLARFNYYQPTEPDRAALPFSVVWRGWWLAAHDEAVTLFVRGRGIRAEVTVDGVPVATLRPDANAARGVLLVREGWRRVRVEVAGSYGAERSLYAGITDASGRDRPFSDADLFVRRVSPARVIADRVVRAASWPIDLIVIVWLIGGAMVVLARDAAQRTPRAVSALLWTAAIVDAFVFAWAWRGRLMLLGGGGDPLTYEFYARDILLHGPLMTLGRPIGHAEAFYYQPLYPYFLALLHGLFGEGFFGVVFVQRLLVALSVMAVWRITRELFGPRVGMVGLGVAAMFLYVKMGHWAAVLLSEILFIPLVCLWAASCLELSDRDDSKSVWASGVTGGLATLARSTLVPALTIVSMLLVAARRRSRASLRPVGVAIAIAIAIAACATLRNWVASGQWVPMTTSFSINFYLGNQPPAWVPVHHVADHALYRWIAREDTTRMALEFARHAPLLFAQNLWHKVLYTLGDFGAFVPGAQPAPALIVTWVAAAVGIIALAWCGVPEGRLGPVRAIPGAIALTHFAVVVLIFPHVYVDRLILPFYALILPYVAAAAQWFVPARNV